LSVQFDLLDDILTMIRLEGTLYAQCAFNGDWGIATQPTPFKKFHIIAQGECWLRGAFLPSPLRLESGDIVAFPQGDPYLLSATPTSVCLPFDEQRLNDLPAEPEAGDEATARIIFGHIVVRRAFDHPFVRHLPPLIHVRPGEIQYRAWLGPVADMLIAETRSTLPGSRGVGKRLAEVLHLYVLRAYILTQQAGFRSVFNDPPLYQALQLIHDAPEADWTLDDMARRVGLSRTTFATRFRELVGTTPMRYITDWRMQKARELLETTDYTLAYVAERVGYQSEAAFARAFQRAFGRTPGSQRIERT
jgi:AraC-like DNA-binding protein